MRLSRVLEYFGFRRHNAREVNSTQDRVSASVDVLRRYAVGDDFGPVNLLLQPVPTVKCNLNCIYCPRSTIISPLIERDIDTECALLSRVFSLPENDVERYRNSRSGYGTVEEMIEGISDRTPVNTDDGLEEAMRADIPTLWQKGLELLASGNGKDMLTMALVVRAFRNYLKNPPVMGPSDYDRVIAEASEMGIKWVDIAGAGEPFTEKDLTIHIMKAIKKECMVGNIITNGTLINDSIAREIVDMEYDTVTISVDSVGPAQDKISQTPGAYEMFLKGLEALHNARAGNTRDKPEIRFNVIYSRHLLDGLHGIMEIASRYGVSSVNIMKPIIYHGSVLDALFVDGSVPGFGEVFVREKEWGEKKGVSLSMDGGKGDHAPTLLYPYADPQWPDMGEKGMQSAVCYEPWLTISVMYDGSVFPCCMQGLSRDSLGNVLSESLHEIYYGKGEEMRKAMLSGQVPYDCRWCPSWYREYQNIYRKAYTGRGDE